MEDENSKLYLLYDINRAEYGEVSKSFSSNYVMFGGYWGDVLDSSHNQVRAVNTNSKIVTFQDIQRRHGSLFNRAFRSIENDFTSETRGISGKSRTTRSRVGKCSIKT